MPTDLIVSPHMKIHILTIFVIIMFAKPLLGFEHTMYIVRHAKPDKEYYGLSEEGKKDAENIAKLFAGKTIERIYTSPHERTRKTAEIIAAGIGFKGTIEIAHELNQDLEDDQKWVNYLQGMAYIDKGKNAILVTHVPVISAFKSHLKADHIFIDFGSVYQVDTTIKSLIIKQLK